MGTTITQDQVAAIIDPYASQIVCASGGTPSATLAKGGIVGVYLAGNAYYFPYGTINEANDEAGEDTLFGLGSVTKTFTTAILGQQPALFGESIAWHLPPGILGTVTMPTFEQLATFTGGILPDSPPGVNTQEEFIQFINDVQFIRSVTNLPLPAPSVYSDSSIGLLAQALMRKDGYRTYGAAETFEWFTNNLLGPLGMSSTVPGPPDPGNPLLATAYAFDDTDKEYVPTKYVGWCPWGAAGRMFSTASDMVRFITAAVGVDTGWGTPVPWKVLGGIRLSLQPWVTIPAAPCHGLRASRQAFAWIVCAPDPEHGSVICGKDGGIRGVSSFVAVNPQYRYGVVVLTNTGGALPQCPTFGMMAGLLPLAVKAS